MAELRILRNLKRGPYVEFNTTGKHWDGLSVFLDEAVFGVLSKSFSQSHENFNYYGPTEFRESKLMSLQKELVKFDSELGEITDFDSFKRIVSTLPMARNLLGELESKDEVDLKLQWDEIVKALREINLTLLELAEHCAKENEVLWVLGI